MPGHPSLLRPILPIPLKAGDSRVQVNGQPLEADFRLISEDTYQRLLNLLALADEVIMQSRGCFPLDGQVRTDCQMIRLITGENFDERKRRAALAREGK